MLEHCVSLNFCPSCPTHECPCTHLQGYGGVGLPAIGNDAVFNQRSELYVAGLNASNYYNVSDDSPDINPNDIPYGKTEL